MAVMKFALISFTKSDAVSIVETKRITTDRDRMTLNNDDWDTSVEVQVTWTERGNKKGRSNQHHAATVLRFSGK